MPGPASSVEEHSLCKSPFTRGPWFESRQGPFFSDAIYSRKFFAQMFDGKSNYRTCYINSHNLTDQKSCCDILYWVKRNVALEIVPMTSCLRVWKDVIQIYYAILQLIYNKQFCNL